MKLRLQLLLAAVGLAGCHNTLTVTFGDIDQQYLFEVEHVNFAWGFVWRGIVIDRQGNIYAYDHSHEAWDNADAESFTEEQLQDKYEHGIRYVGRIDEATVIARFARIAGIEDQLTEPQYPCADAGALTYTAFRFDSVSELYHPLLLRQEGDMVRENTSDAAEDLADWLRGLLSALENPGVSSFNDGVCTP